MRLSKQDGELHDVEFAVDDPKVQVPLLLERVVAAGGKVLVCAPRERSLTEVLSELTGGQTA